MDIITGEAITADGPRIIRRLCKHWSHKFEVVNDDTSGVIQLNEVKLTLQATVDRVSIQLENPGGDVPQRLLGVVAEHMQRMAGPEAGLQVSWDNPAV